MYQKILVPRLIGTLHHRRKLLRSDSLKQVPSAYNGTIATSIDYVDDLHEDIEDKAQRKERKELLSLIGNCSVLFDLDEDDEDENIE